MVIDGKSFGNWERDGEISDIINCSLEVLWEVLCFVSVENDILNVIF